MGGTTEGGAAFGPIETTTSGDGTYSVASVPNGVYTVGAAKSGYLLNPTSHAVTISGGNSTGKDFTASMNPVAFNANGGAGTAGAGGAGGQFRAVSFGSIKVLNSGTVDATFSVPTITADLGANPFIVSADTAVTNTDDTPGALCQVYEGDGGDGSLYVGDGNGTCDGGDTQVSGLTIAAGATLVLFDPTAESGSLRLTNDLVINGTLTTDLSVNEGLSIEANLIEVGSTGRITASATIPGNSGGEIQLGQEGGLTRTIINRGTIESKGDGAEAGGYIQFEPSDLVVNVGTIDVSGGNDGGSGGVFVAYVDYGDFYSSGTVRMNGGNGTTYGGDTEYYSENRDGYSCYIETAYKGNTNGRNGDIIISGTWEAKGGDGASGNGGGGGYMYFQTDGMGTITVNASMSVKGGIGTGAGSSGGYAGEIDFTSALDPNYNGGYSDPTPGKISISGAYDLRGGDGDQDGGGGGYLQVTSQGLNLSSAGSDVEFIAFPVVVMNGGDGAENGGAAYSNAFELYTYNPSESVFAKSITNEADIQAKGGNATAGGTGGAGGYVYMQTTNPGDAGSFLVNSGNIDVTAGGGETGGQGGFVDMEAQHVDNTGSLTANGGDGTTAGGSGGSVFLLSNDIGTPTNTTGTLSVTGGAPDGGLGAITIDGGGGPE
jgi:hypothetical protein